MNNKNIDSQSESILDHLKMLKLAYNMHFLGVDDDIGFVLGVPVKTLPLRCYAWHFGHLN